MFLNQSLYCNITFRLKMQGSMYNSLFHRKTMNDNFCGNDLNQQVFELPQKLHIPTPMTPSCLADRRHLVGLILRDVDIFMIQIKGKRCGNFRVIERLFLRRAPLNEHYTHLLLYYLLAAIPAETTRQFSVSLQRGHLQCPLF